MISSLNLLKRLHFALKSNKANIPFPLNNLQVHSNLYRPLLFSTFHRKDDKVNFRNFSHDDGSKALIPNLTKLKTTMLYQTREAKPDDLGRSLGKIIGELKSEEIGICVTLFSNYRKVDKLFSFKSEDSFPMASIYKIPIVIYCLHLIEKKFLSLNQEYRVIKEDIVERQSPDRCPRTILKEGDLITIEKLLLYVMQYSCNTATDIILKLVGGPKIVSEYIQNNIGIKNLKIDRTMKDALHDITNYDDGRSDRGSPEAMNLLLTQVFSRNVLSSQASVDYLFRLMESCIMSDNIVDQLIRKDGCEVGNKNGSIPGKLNHIVSIIKLSKDRGELIISIFMRHQLTEPEANIFNLSDWNKKCEKIMNMLKWEIYDKTIGYIGSSHQPDPRVRF